MINNAVQLVARIFSNCCDIDRFFYEKENSDLFFSRRACDCVTKPINKPSLSIHEKLECTSDQTAIGNCIALFINKAYVDLLFPEM